MHQVQRKDLENFGHLRLVGQGGEEQVRRKAQPGAGFGACQPLPARLHQQVGGGTGGGQRQADALRFGIPARVGADARQVAQGMQAELGGVVNESLHAVPQRQGFLQYSGRELPAVAFPGGNGKDFKRAPVFTFLHAQLHAAGAAHPGQRVVEGNGNELGHTSPPWDVGLGLRCARRSRSSRSTASPAKRYAMRSSSVASTSPRS